MQRIIVTLLLLNLHTTVFGQDDDTCSTGSFTGLNDCMKKSVQDVMSVSIDVNLKEEAYSCFENNGCLAPVEGNNIFGSGSIDVYGSNSAQQVGDCFLKTANNATLAIEKCVQDSGYANFVTLHASDMNSVNYQQSFVKEFLKVKDALDQCPRRAQGKIWKCLLGLMSKMSNVITALKTFCKSTKACVKGFSCDFNDIRKQVCACGKSVLNTVTGSVNRYEDGFFQCLNQPVPDRRDLIPFVRKVQDLICFGDPCEAITHFATKTGGGVGEDTQAHSTSDSDHRRNVPT